MKTLLIGATQHIAERFLYTVLVVFLVVSLVFFLIHLVPGDPVQLASRSAPGGVSSRERDAGDSGVQLSGGCPAGPAISPVAKRVL